jgi:hypothetical protein
VPPAPHLSPARNSPIPDGPVSHLCIITLGCFLADSDVFQHHLILLERNGQDEFQEREAQLQTAFEENSPDSGPQQPIGAVGSNYPGPQLSSIPADIHMPIAERRIRRERRLPLRFRDTIPVALPQVPPGSEVPNHQSMPSSEFPPIAQVPSISSRLRRVIQTPRNVFGLFRRYFLEKLPSHDPEENLDLLALFDIQHPATTAPLVSPLTPPPSPTPSENSPFYPYPNYNSFLLGNWYWSGSAQKSQESFRELLGIVGDANFRPDDVKNTKWAAINAKLAKNPFDNKNGDDPGDDAWMDEDAGWKKSKITISVPFHKRNKNPGPKDYIVGELYHRSLVSVIREKLANPIDSSHFHYDPFKVYWNRDQSRPDVRVYGELYTSPAFLEAHNALQNSPGEPGCHLPRVVVSLMFWSDMTHLTSFGSAKLWPCYLSFGNESKYRRCKPNLNLMNHVAYFETVSASYLAFAFGPNIFTATRCV